MIPLQKYTTRFNNFIAAKNSRTQNVLKGSLVMLTSSLLANLSRVGIVFVLSHYYSKEEFGIWAAITATGAIIATGDFGIINSLRNKLSELRIQGDKGLVEAKNYFFYSFIFFFFLCLILSTALVILSNLLPYSELFKTSDLLLKRQGTSILLWIQFLFFLNIPLGMGAACFFSFHESKYSAIFSLGQALLSFLLVLIQTAVSSSIVSISINYFIINTLTSAVGTFYFLKRRNWLTWINFNWTEFYVKVKELLISGVKFMGLQLSNSFLQNAGTIVASSTLGLSAAATFNMAQKLFTLVVSIYQSMFNPIWGGYAESYIRKDFAWCKKTLFTSLKISAIVFILGSVLLVLFGNFFLAILAGKDYIVSQSLFLYLGIGTLFFILFTSSSIFQLAIGRINVLLILSLVLSVLITPLTKKLAIYASIDGIAIASAIIWFFMFLSINFYSNYILRRDMIEDSMGN